MILGIFGAGSLGREVLELAKEINQKQNRWDLIDFVVDVDEKEYVDKIRVVRLEDFAKLDEKEVVIALGNPFDRQLVRDKLTECNVELASPLIHPMSRISDNASIGKGTIINSFCSVSLESVIGENVYIQPACGIGHNVYIGDNCVLSAGSRYAGYAEVGKNTYVGMMVPVKDRTKIGANSIVSMGSVVLRDIPEDMIAVGNPARAVKRNENHTIF